VLKNVYNPLKGLAKKQRFSAQNHNRFSLSSSLLPRLQEILSAPIVLLAFRSRTLYRAAVPIRVQSHFAFLSTLGLLGLAHLTQLRRFRDLGSVQQPSKNWAPNSFSFHPSDFDSAEFTGLPTRTSTLTVYCRGVIGIY
jgi:hypothetical protein